MASSLLDRPDAAAEAAYYQALCAAAPGLVVRPDAGGGKGKGLFTTRAIKQGDTVLRERAIVGTQELHSKMEVTACAHCYTAVGTVEQAFGGKICCLINELSEATEEDDLRAIQDSVDKIQAAIDSAYLEGLLSNTVHLPLADKLGLPTDPVKCRGGCGEEFCSSACEAAAWQRHHCLLCPGTASSSSSAGASHRAGSSSSSKARQKAAAQVDVVHGVTVNRAKLAAFFEHADETNDVFRVAAQVVASTLITADKLLQQAAGDAAEAAEAAAAFGRAASAAAAGARTAGCVLTAGGDGDGDASEQQQSQCQQQQQQQQQQQPSQEQCWAALQAAFLPFAVGHKRPWWDVAAEAEAAAAEAAGDDSGSDSSSAMAPEEVAAQMRELASDSLALLAAGLKDERFPQLFDLQLYGSLVGMFELNNLALTVPAPVGRYKAALDQPVDAGLSPAEAAAALAQVAPLLHALGERADGPAEGTGFFCVQSTINHSCAPNAEASCLASGEMVVTALADIEPGSEVVLSYIDEGAGVRERQARLRDYGFTCACMRCEAEQLAAGLQAL